MLAHAIAHLPVICPGQNTHTHSAKSSWNIFHCSGAHPQSQVLHQGPTSMGPLRAGPCYESPAVEQVHNGITTKARDQTTKFIQITQCEKFGCSLCQKTISWLSWPKLFFLYHLYPCTTQLRHVGRGSHLFAQRQIKPSNAGSASTWRRTTFNCLNRTLTEYPNISK